MKPKAVLLVIVIASLLGALVYSQNQKPLRRVSGIIEADEIRVGSRVGGRVAEVLVEEGDHVQAGDVLVRLEPFGLKERLAEAQSLLAARKAEYEKLKSGLRPQEIAQAKSRVARAQSSLDKLKAGPLPQEISASRSRLELAQAQLDRARKSHERSMALMNKSPGVITRDEIDQVVEVLRVAESMEQVRREELELLEKGTRVEDIAIAEAELDQAKLSLSLAEEGFRAEEVSQAKEWMAAADASVQAIKEQLNELDVRAGITGVVDAMQLRPGDLVPANGPVMTILDTSRLWIRAFVPENELDLQLGQSFEVEIDSYPGKKFEAELTYLAKRGEFTPRNAQTVDERSKQVFRIKLQLKRSLEGLHPGMAADVWIDRPTSSGSKK